jgi:hypothetical protein
MVLAAGSIPVAAAITTGASTKAATSTKVAAAARATRSSPDLTLTSETPWVTPTAPWLTLDFGVGATSVPVGDLKVVVTFFSRIDASSQLQQDFGSTPDRGEIIRLTLPVTETSVGRAAATCVTVVPEYSSTPPAPAAGTTGACAPGATTVVLGCTPDVGVCGDVYPVAAELQRTGSGTALSRLTTFLTYQEPGGACSSTPLRVSLVMPIGSAAGDALAPPSDADRTVDERETAELSANRAVTLTLAVNPRSEADLVAHGGRTGRSTVDVLADMTTAPSPDQLLPQPFVPINLGELAGAGLAGEITAQLDRGSDVLRSRAGGLHPGPGPWFDPTSTFTTADAGSLADGLRTAGDDHLVLSDSNLSTGGSNQLTFAQPFTLDLGHDARVTAVSTNGLADSRFSAYSGDPVLAANQLLSTLEWIHFEDACELVPRGVVVTPPASWGAPGAFVTTLLGGLAGNPALSTVTLNQLFTQVPVGGNDEPTARTLQSGPVPAAQRISNPMAARIATARDHLSSFSEAVSGHPAALTTLADTLLATESAGFDPAQRSFAVSTYTARFNHALDAITLSAERTVTFTSRTAAIPVTVLSSAPYTVTVTMSLDSDKFAFPNGSTRRLVLNRPTTPVRIEARARTSGDHLPVEVTLRTPDGQLIIAQAQLTVHSTVISLVGIALTVLAGLTLLIWWGRTWQRGRRRRPRAH